MKIVRVFPAFQETLKYAEHYTARELTGRGHDVTIVTTNVRWSTWKGFVEDDFSPGTYVRDNYRLVRFRSLIALDKGFPINVPGFLATIFRKDVDVIHCTGLATPLTIAVLTAARFLRKPPRIVVSDHSNEVTAKRTGFFAEVYRCVLLVALRMCSKSCAKILTYSEESRDFIADRFKVDRGLLTIVPLGLDAEVFHYQERRNDNAAEVRTIGFAGKMGRDKEVERLINAVARCSNSDSIQLTLAGRPESDDGYGAELEELAASLDVSATFLPMLGPSDLAEFYNSLDLAVFPGRVSITTLEASACGVPILLYRSVGGLENRVADGRGTLFENEDELVELLDQFMMAEPVESGQRQAIAGKTQDAYAWHSIVQDYLDAYRDAA